MSAAVVADRMDAEVRAASLVVRDFRSADAVRWDAFVLRCPQATFFHRIGPGNISDNSV